MMHDFTDYGQFECRKKKARTDGLAQYCLQNISSSMSMSVSLVHSTMTSFNICHHQGWLREPNIAFLYSYQSGQNPAIPQSRIP